MPAFNGVFGSPNEFGIKRCFRLEVSMLLQKEQARADDG